MTESITLASANPNSVTILQTVPVNINSEALLAAVTTTLVPFGQIVPLLPEIAPMAVPNTTLVTGVLPAKTILTATSILCLVLTDAKHITLVQNAPSVNPNKSAIPAPRTGVPYTPLAMETAVPTELFNPATPDAAVPDAETAEIAATVAAEENTVPINLSVTKAEELGWEATAVQFTVIFMRIPGAITIVFKTEAHGILGILNTIIVLTTHLPLFLTTWEAANVQNTPTPANPNAKRRPLRLNVLMPTTWNIKPTIIRPVHGTADIT